MLVVCEKWVETRTDCNIDPSSSSTIAALLPHLGWGCSTVGLWGPQSAQSASWFSRWHPVSNCLEPSGHLVILFSNDHLLPLFFRLFTQLHLLIDTSVEGQYITPVLLYKKIMVKVSFFSFVLASWFETKKTFIGTNKEIWSFDRYPFWQISFWPHVWSLSYVRDLKKKWWG